MPSLLILAADSAGHTHEAPDAGTGIGIIVATFIGVILVVGLLFYFFVRQPRI